jgi:hypothetical protein
MIKIKKNQIKDKDFSFIFSFQKQNQNAFSNLNEHVKKPWQTSFSILKYIYVFVLS